MGQMAERDCRNRCVGAQGCLERLRKRWLFGIDPVLVMNALNQLPARTQFPRELRKDLVLLVLSWQARIGAWLAVVVAQILISRKEPQSLADSRSAKARRE